MTQQVKINLGDVQKTLFLPLWGRAEESKKQKPMLVDETALKIIEQVDFDFSQITRNIDELSQIAWIKRSLFCDRVVKGFLMRHPQGTIINIGCGLDTTFERIDNGKLKWYDLDLPDVIALRKKFVKENERRKFIASSFLEKDWLVNIEVIENVLFIAAGVFYFFEEQEIQNFIVRLIETYPGSEIIFDVSSPLGVRIANKKVVESSGLDEKSHLVWGLENKKEILAWDTRIKIIGTYYYFRTLRIGIRNLLMGTLSDFLGIQYMLHLRLGSSE
jgi:O-methyltransferase involved in polyketide biosynthesis